MTQSETELKTPFGSSDSVEIGKEVNFTDFHSTDSGVEDGRLGIGSSASGPPPLGVVDTLYGWLGKKG